MVFSYKKYSYFLNNENTAIVSCVVKSLKIKELQ